MEKNQKFKFTQTPSKHLYCKVCQALMMDQPTRLHPCGHVLCSACITYDKQVLDFCPICFVETTKKQKDLLVLNLIDDLPTECLNKDCLWRGSYCDYRKFHEKQCVLKDCEGIQSWLKSIETSVKKYQLKKGKNETEEENLLKMSQPRSKYKKDLIDQNC